MGDTLFQDIFTVQETDPEGKKFDRGMNGLPQNIDVIGHQVGCLVVESIAAVSTHVIRIVAKSEQFDVQLHLDINSEIYPMHKGEKFLMGLASTLNLDGTPDSGYFMQGGRKSLADRYEYVMQGKLYKISEQKPGKADILASFGGLLMWLNGDTSLASKFELDQRLFILIRKV